jgi:GTP pyrophosphokinase
MFQEIRRYGLSEELLFGENINFVLEFLNLKDLADLFVRVGQDLLSPHLILYYLKPATKGPDHTADDEAIRARPSEKNMLFVSELDKAIHKFARCCSPYPGQDQLVAILSERGTTFHRQDCQDLFQKHDLQPQQFLEVVWNKNTVWRHPLLFHINVFLETVHSLIPALARTPSNIALRNLESYADRHEQPMVRLTVQFRDFSEAERFFACLPKNRASIEDYWRAEGPLGIQTGHPDKT